MNKLLLVLGILLIATAIFGPTVPFIIISGDWRDPQFWFFSIGVPLIIFAWFGCSFGGLYLIDKALEKKKREEVK